MISESKVTLARLLAEEEVFVEETNNKEASFDLNTRTLYIPRYKESVSVDVTDLLISHEVGHALYTPVSEWKEIISTIPIDIVNILEDSRIERLIRLRYPGLRSIFYRAYKEIYEMDIFGIKKLLNTPLNLIDRINLVEKFGALPEISFTDKELILLLECRKTKTFNDVIKLAKKILKFTKEENKGRILSKSMIEEFVEYNIEFTDISEIERQIVKTIEENEGLLESEELNEEESELSVTPSQIPSELDETESKTLEEIQQGQLNLLDTYTSNSIYVDIPDIDINNLMVDHRTFYNRIRRHYWSYYYDHRLHTKIKTDLFDSFKKKNSNVISYMVKEFLLKKNAKGRKKDKVSDTGDINEKKLYSYQLTDNIFRTKTITYKEQSHGLVFFLDWSQSMLKDMPETIKQLLNLVLFCKKLNIPFEVYIFTNYYKYDDIYDANERSKAEFKKRYNHKLHHADLTLVNILSSKMTNKEFNYAANFLLSFDFLYYHFPEYIKLFGTPLNTSIVFVRKVLDIFQSKNRVQKVNCIFLTDGESHDLYFTVDKSYSYCGYGTINKVVNNLYLRDREKHVVQQLTKTNTIGNELTETDECIEFIRKTCSYKFLGFRLIGQNTFSKQFRNKDSIIESFKKHKFLEKEKTGFHKYFYVKNVNINEDEFEIEENASVAKITSAFKKNLQSSLETRTFLKHYIDFIS